MSNVDDLRLQTEWHDLNDTRIQESLKSSLEEVKTQLVFASEVEQIYRLQGKAQVFSEIIGNIEKAYDKIVELRRDKATMSKSF